MKKIIYIHPYGTPTSMSGLARPHFFAREFKKKGYDVEIWTSSFLHYEGMQFSKNKIVVDDITFKFIRTPSYNGFAMRFINMFIFFCKTRRNMKKEKNAENVIYISSMPHFGSVSPLFAFGSHSKSKVIVEVRDLWPDAFFNAGIINKKSLLAKILVHFEKLVYKKADSLVMLKEGDISYLEENGWIGEIIDAGDIHYINNGVDLEEFDYLQKNVTNGLSFSSDKLNVTYVGSIRPMNDVKMLIETARISSNKIHFHIFGDGTQLNELREIVHKEKISNVSLYGRVDRKYVPNLLSQSDILLLHYSESDYDWSRGNSSNKLFEYFAAGKPIISTIDFAYNPIKKYSCGKVVNNSPEALKVGLEDYLKLSSKEYERQCKNSKYVANEYNYCNLANKYIKIMEELK